MRRLHKFRKHFHMGLSEVAIRNNQAISDDATAPDLFLEDIYTNPEFYDQAQPRNRTEYWNGLNAQEKQKIHSDCAQLNNLIRTKSVPIEGKFPKSDDYLDERKEQIKACGQNKAMALAHWAGAQPDPGQPLQLLLNEQAQIKLKKIGTKIKADFVEIDGTDYLKVDQRITYQMKKVIPPDSALDPETEGKKEYGTFTTHFTGFVKVGTTELVTKSIGSITSAEYTIAVETDDQNVLNSITSAITSKSAEDTAAVSAGATTAGASVSNQSSVALVYTSDKDKEKDSRYEKKLSRLDLLKKYKEAAYDYLKTNRKLKISLKKPISKQLGCLLKEVKNDKHCKNAIAALEILAYTDYVKQHPEHAEVAKYVMCRVRDTVKSVKARVTRGTLLSNLKQCVSLESIPHNTQNAYADIHGQEKEDVGKIQKNLSLIDHSLRQHKKAATQYLKTHGLDIETANGNTVAEKIHSLHSQIRVNNMHTGNIRAALNIIERAEEGLSASSDITPEQAMKNITQEISAIKVRLGWKKRGSKLLKAFRKLKNISPTVNEQETQTASGSQTHQWRVGHRAQASTQQHRKGCDAEKRREGDSNDHLPSPPS